MTAVSPIKDAPKVSPKRKNLPLSEPLRWLASGWRDLWTNPWPSLLYGLGVSALSALVVWLMLSFGWDHILFPALAGFLVVGPALATGLYEKSRRLAVQNTVQPADLIHLRRGAGYHILFVGAILAMLMLVWMRAAVLLFALFWGWLPFPGLDRVVEMLLTTPNGWMLLIVGTFVGGLFAALAYAISAFSIPMLLERELDAFTAMGTSMAYVWHNKPVMIVWGAIVLGLTIVGIATAFLGFIIIFPLLAHATWHSYVAVCAQDK